MSSLPIIIAIKTQVSKFCLEFVNIFMLHVAFSLSKFYFEFIVLYFTVLDNISCLPAEMIFDLPNSILTLYLSLHTGWTRDSVGRVWQNTARGVACEAEAIDNDLWYPVIQPQRTGHNWHRARKKKNKKKREDFLTQVGQQCNRKKGLDGSAGISAISQNLTPFSAISRFWRY